MDTPAPRVFTSKKLPPTKRGSALRSARLKGTLIQVKRGLYFEPRSNRVVDPFELLRIGFPSPVVSHHSALELLGRAYSHRDSYTAFTNTDQRAFHFQGYQFTAAAFPKALRKKNLSRTETIEVMRNGQQITVTSLERSLVDCLSRPELAGGLKEVWRGFDAASKDLEVESLCRYAIQLENKTLIGLLGYFLDQLPLRLSAKYRKLLHQHAPKAPHYAAAAPGNGTLISFWNVVVPRSLVERTWEAAYIAKQDDEALWASMPGLVWSNTQASNDSRIAAALLYPRFTQLLEIAAHFGSQRLRKIWADLREHSPTEAKRAEPHTRQILANIFEGERLAHATN